MIPAAVGAAATGARVVHLGNSAGALATPAGPAIRNNGVSILTYAIFTVPARERSDAFARLAEHAAAGELTVEYSETGLEALPAIWDDFAARRAGADQDHRQAEGGNPLMTGPARTGVQQDTTGPSPGFPARDPLPRRSCRPAEIKGPGSRIDPEPRIKGRSRPKANPYRSTELPAFAIMPDELLTAPIGQFCTQPLV